MVKVLIIDDEQSSAENLRHLLEDRGYQVAGAHDGAEGLKVADLEDFQAVVTDYRMPRVDGLEVIKTLHMVRPQLPVILISSLLTPELAIEAKRLGAYGCVVKPADPAELLGLVEQAVTRIWVAGSVLVGKSQAMRNVCEQIGRVAATPATVLIRGEPGTGKELIALAIHEHSARAEHPFVALNCAACSEGMLHHVLFGDPPDVISEVGVRRAGVLEEANGGTLFLYGIGNLSPRNQAGLRGVLEDGPTWRGGGVDRGFDVRLIAATHCDLEQAVREGAFREDLYDRLNDAVIFVPPLRDRREDIPDLVKFFIQRDGLEEGPGKPLTDEEMADLQQQPWPGNVDELRDFVREKFLRPGG